MRKSLLFLAIYSFGMSEACGEVEMNLSFGSPGREIGLHEIKNQENVYADKSDSIHVVVKKGLGRRLAESVGRVALGTATIAGTTLVGVAFVEAICRAKAQGDLWNSTSKLGSWKEYKSFGLSSFRFAISRKEKVAPSFSQVFLDKIGCGGISWLRNVGSQSVDTVFSSYFFFPGILRLLGTGKNFVVSGYKFGGKQIYKGVWGVWTSDNLAKAS